MIGATLLAYAGVWHNGFVGWDDPQYITGNSHVLGGLSWSGIAWAFRSTESANWHPVTWLSHMLDVTLFGTDAGMHHVVSLVFHLLNASLLFGIFHRLTGAAGRSAVVAALFAVHPLHVESVAWAAERKDVLSAFFFMLTLLAYTAYVERRDWWRYSLVVAAFALGLMSKPMLVTLPFVLLLLDFWPLARRERMSWPALVGEKLPLFALALAASVVTLLAQRRGGAVSELVTVPIGWRISNAIVSYVRYIGKSVWPIDLATLYPFAAPFDRPAVVLAFAFLVGASIGAVIVRKRAPYVTVGWFWFAGTLVPVIGLVQVGYQAMADRYTYIPLIGLSVAAVWTIDELLASWSVRRIVSQGLAVAAILACVMLTRRQVRVWHDGITLWQHAVANTDRNYVAHTNLGYEYAERERFDEAIVQYQNALRIDPTFVPALQSLGLALAKEGRIGEAAAQYELAIRIQPSNARLRADFGLALANARHYPEAAAEFEQALRLEPDLAIAHLRLANVLVRQARTADAIDEYERALRLDPASAEAHNNFGVALAQQGRVRDAAAQFSAALQLDPGYADARNNLARAADRLR